MDDFDPRRAEPGTRFGYTTPDGSQREIVADDEGVVRPKDAADVAVLDLYELPVARKVLAAEKAQASAKADDTKKPADTGGEG